MSDQPSVEAVYSNDWRWNSQAPPPINGQIRTNSQDWSNAATHLYVSYQTDAGLDVSTQLKQIVSGNQIDIAMKTDATRSVRFIATAAPAIRSEQIGDLAVTYADIPVTFVTFSGAIPNSGTLVTFSVTSSILPPPTTISYTIVALAGRPNRFQITCTCLHGSLTELCATSGGSPRPSPSYIESTANNLCRRYGCTCAGLVAGATAAADEAQFEEVADAVGL